MRSLSKLAFLGLLIAIAPAAFAQGTESSTIAVEQPWARATPAGAMTGAAYMAIDNKSNLPDRLIGASSNIAKTLQIHEMAVVNGVMKMRELANGLPIPAGGSVTLKPGSYHVMLIGLKKPLKPGETFPLMLKFKKAGNIPVKVSVQAMGTMQDNKTGGMGKMEMK